MNYKEKVDTFVSIIKEAINNKISIQIILNSEVAYDVAKELYYENKERFEDYTEDMFDELLSKNGILSVCVLCSSDGDIKLFLEEVFDTKGNTLYDDVSDFIFIEDELYDCINKESFEGLVIVISENKDEYGYDEEDELDELFEELTEEVLQDILDNQDNSNFCLYCTIKNRIQEAYEIGLHDGLYEE